MHEVEQLAEEMGCQAIRFDALLENTKLISFYHCKFNYEIRDIVREKDPFQDNLVWNTVVFEKIL